MNEKIFFSYATVAPMSTVAYEATETYLDDFYTIGPPEVLYKYDPLSESLAEEAAKLLNCSADEITYIKNTSEGNIIASEALPLVSGDEVLLLGEEYPANLLPWLKKRRDGISIKVIPSLHGAEAVEKLLESVSERTQAIVISSAQYYDGYMADLDRISKLTRERGIYFVVDAVQTIGIRALDVSHTPIDILTCGGQKFLQAGPGIGFMYVNKEIIPRLKDFKVSIRSMTSFDSDSYQIRNTAARFQDGTQNLAGIAALHAALKDVNARGIDVIEAQCQEVLAGIKKILRSYNIDFIDHSDHQSNIVSMKIGDPKSLVAYLQERKIYIKQIKDVARLSFNAQSSLDQVEELARVTSEWVKRSAF